MFPHPCTHCGLCCIAQVCPLGQAAMRVPKQGPCYALEWDEANPDQSRCGLIAHPEKYLPPATIAALSGEHLPTVIGSGAGCCISARVAIGNRVEDFAALPPETKVAAVRAIRANHIPLFQSEIQNPQSSIINSP